MEIESQHPNESSRPLIYLSHTSPISHGVLWACRSLEISFDERRVQNLQDMADILERNPRKVLPVLQDGDLFLSDSVSILKYLISISPQKTNTKWPGLSKDRTNPKLEAKMNDVISFAQDALKPAVKDFLSQQNTSIFDTVPDSQAIDKLQKTLAELDSRKRGHQFICDTHFTIADIVVYSAIAPLLAKSSGSEQINWDIAKRIEGWSKVVRKILADEWLDESSCLDSYDSEGEEEGYYLAETILDAVKNDRPDILDKLANDGANINMPLAVVEAVNRGNLPCLKAMRDHGCCLKWPMAITMARRLSKCEDLLAILLGHTNDRSKEELEDEADEIISEHNKKMRREMGLPEVDPKEEQAKKQAKLAREKAGQAVNTTIQLPPVELGSQAPPPGSTTIPISHSGPIQSDGVISNISSIPKENISDT